MTARPPHPPTGFRLDLPPDLDPLYVNVARISHTPSEIVLDFARLLPGVPENQVQTRLIMAPLAAKLFLRALSENLARYESMFGEIQLPKGDSGLANSLFGRVQPPEPPEQSE